MSVHSQNTYSKSIKRVRNAVNDHLYNIRGWLTAINSSQLALGNDTNLDLFGMELLYNQVDGSLSNTGLFNGNISAMKWSDRSATGAGNARAYTYGYDKLNRLSAANHFENNSSTSKYGVSGLTYDLNGNIGALTRKGTTGSDMDALAYSYTGNQLQYVNDTSGDAEGFDNNNTGTNIDYGYDPNGNMTQDLNKGISSIQYNHLNLPTAVILNDSEGSHTINYLYDAAGIKLQQKVYDGGVLAKTTDYVGEFIYETVGTGTRQLQLIQHEEGRLTPLPGGVGFDYQYHLKDHLGNTRLTFSTTPENYQMVETFETGETNGFEDLHRFTNTNANTTIGGNEVERLQSGQTGAMVFLSLNKGDTVDLSVQANYETAPSGNNFLQTAYNTLFTSFDNVYGSGVEGGVTSTSTEFSDAISGTNMAGKSGSSTAPRAFLNYIFFDKNMNYVNAGFAQISTAAQGIGVHESVSLNDVIADREGYILAYLSNENTETVNVHFDDFTINHGKTNIVQADDYYPGGALFNSYTRTASSPQNFKYQGKEYLEDGLNLYDFGARMYDPYTWRTPTIDPLADQFRDQSPYSFQRNNPIRFIDPTGMAAEDWVEREDGSIYWDENATSQATTQAGEKYLGKNVLVATHNRDENGQEAVNSATFDLYLESDKSGPTVGSTASIDGNTVPSDITKNGTLAEGVYPAKFQARASKPGENALIINGGGELPTVNGNPNKENSDNLTEIFFHRGNPYQESLNDSGGNPVWSHGCLTGGCGQGSEGKFNTFMGNAQNFDGVLYLRSKPTTDFSLKQLILKR